MLEPTILHIKIPSRRFWNDVTERFVTTKSYEFDINHCLLSISKWEMLYKKPFLGRDEKTRKELIDYVKCMCLTEGTPDEAFESLTDVEWKEIADYINNEFSASKWYVNDNQSRSTKVVTSEQIYCWMACGQVPFTCETWHLSRLMILLRAIGEANAPKKKYTQKETIDRIAQRNKARRQALKSKG